MGKMIIDEGARTVIGMLVSELFLHQDNYLTSFNQTGYVCDILQTSWFWVATLAQDHLVVLNYLKLSGSQ